MIVSGFTRISARVRIERFSFWLKMDIAMFTKKKKKGYCNVLGQSPFDNHPPREETNKQTSFEWFSCSP